MENSAKRSNAGPWHSGVTRMTKRDDRAELASLKKGRIVIRSVLFHVKLTLVREGRLTR